MAQFIKKISATFHILLVLFTAVSLQNCSAGKSAQPASRARLWEYKTGHTNLYSWSDDIKLGESVQKQQLTSAKNQGVKVDGAGTQALQNRIQKIVSRLTKVSDFPKLPYEVHVYDVDIANAFCLPGGKIGVFTGLFDKKKGLVNLGSDDEIAAVLGHEIAHATLRHTTRRMTTAQGVGVLGAVVSATIGDPNGKALFNQAFNISASFAFPSYSRAHETEADKVGLYYMAKAGYNPQAAANIWSRLDKKTKDNSDFLASHPSNGKRAAFLTGYLPDANLVRQGKAPARKP